MRIRTLAHLSDLHFGVSPEAERTAEALCDALLSLQVDHVVVTGDLTHKGRYSELERFEQTFGPLLRRGRLTVVPGNHDRVGDDAGATLMDGERVAVREAAGLYLVRVDSTAEHNRSYFAPHGELAEETLAQIDQALSRAPTDALTAVLLHHHPVPLPEETVGERFATRMGWPHARELHLGEELVRRARGRCDLLLHGHRHVPRELQVAHDGGRPLGVYNGGASTELAGFRLFTHAGGRLLGAPRWIELDDARVGPPRLSAMGAAVRELFAVFA